MNYLLVQSQIAFKLAADIFVIKKTTHMMGGSFTTGSIKFKKRKQAMKPEIVLFITAMAERVSLEAALKQSSQMLSFNKAKCSGVLTGRRRPGRRYLGRIRRRLGEGTRNRRKKFKRQCREECRGKQKGRRKCVNECTMRNSRSALLQNGGLGAEEKERLCLEKCADKGMVWPDHPMCFNDCLGLKEFLNEKYQPQALNPQRPVDYPRQQSRWPSTTGSLGRKREGVHEAKGLQLTSGNGFESGWLEMDFNLKKK